MTTTELRELMVELLAGAAGGDPARWRECVGDVKWQPMSTIVPNWTIEPTGTVHEIEAIRHAERIVRDEHRFVTQA
jgi:hypothetical protein